MVITENVESVPTVNASHSFWGTSNQSEISTSVYDGMDDSNFTIVNYHPFFLPSCTQASFVKLESTEKQIINLFEVEIIDTDGNDISKVVNVNASQSSTFKGLARFQASNAIDGKATSFSHTDNDSPWWQVKLAQEADISSIHILNRWCGDLRDPQGCMCRLSNATLSLLDNQGEVIAAQSTGNTCHKPSLKFHFSCNPCLPSAHKIKLQSTLGEPLQMLEVEVYSSGSNIVFGKTVTQSSTFQGRDDFAAYMAVDGDLATFSHTRARSVEWWEIDLDGSYPIESMKIYNRWCSNALDPQRCLCRLSYGIVFLLNKEGEVITSVLIGDMCGELVWMHDFSTSSEYCTSHESV